MVKGTGWRKVRNENGPRPVSLETMHAPSDSAFFDITAWMLPILLAITPGMLLLLNVPFLFGYARPVPVDRQRLRHPRRDSILVSAAGPASNILQAIVALALLKAIGDLDGLDWIAANLGRMIAFNVSLAAFNLLPIPPLDGAHIAIDLLPRPLSRSLAAMMPHGMALLIALVVVLPAIGHAAGVDLDVIGRLLNDIVRTTIDGLHWLLSEPRRGA